MTKKREPTLLEAATERLTRIKARDSLLTFTEYTHPSWVTSEHHVKLCYYLELLEALAPCPYCGCIIDSLGVSAPPRHSKTELVSRRFPAWCIGRHPEWQLICAQATGLLASDTGADVREIIKSPEFQRVFPQVTLREDAQAAGRWITNGGGIYYAAGVDGTIVGRGANILNIDDPHTGRQAADSQRMRDIAGNWYFGDALTRLMPPARQIITQTRWHQDDLTGRVLPPPEEWIETDDHQFFCAGDWHVLRFRAIEFESSEHEKALWPGRYSLEYLHKRRRTMQKAGRNREWEAQYQQNPVVEEGTFFKRDWYSERYTEIPQDSIYYIGADFAVTEKRMSNDPDRTEFAVLALAPDDRIYIADWVTLVTAPDVWISSLIDLIRRWKPQAIFGEKGTIKNSIWPALNRALEEEKVVAFFDWMPTVEDKKARARTQQVWAGTKRIHFPQVSTWADKVVDELVAFGGGGRFDDKVDALSNFFLAIDTNHPMVLRPQEKQYKKRDVWEVIPGGRVDSWRTAS